MCPALKDFVEGKYRGPSFDGGEKEMLRQVTNGLVYLHVNLRTVHRDLKPSNVFISLGMTG